MEIYFVKNMRTKAKVQVYGDDFTFFLATFMGNFSCDNVRKENVSAKHVTKRGKREKGFILAASA